MKHRDVHQIHRDAFTRSFVSECTTHTCRCGDDGGRTRIDACCQHGADVLIPEKLAALRRAPEIASIMRPGRRDPADWFDERNPEQDPEAPFGVVLRTATSDPDDDASGCVFLDHEGGRGCGLHLAALTHGFDPAEIKPSVCRLYPLSLSNRRLELSADFNRYSCAFEDGPSVYRTLRATLRQMFDADLIEALDEVESHALGRVSGDALVSIGRSS